LLYVVFATDQTPTITERYNPIMNEAPDKATVSPAAALTEDVRHESQRVLRLVLFDALASEAMGTLTTGVFLVGFAVALGADNFAIGVLAAVPFFAQLL